MNLFFKNRFNPPLGKFKPATTAKNLGKGFGCSCGCGDWTILLNLEVLLLVLNYVKASSLRSLSLSLSLSSTLFSSMLWSITMDPNSLNKIAAGLDWKSVKFFLSHDQGFVFQIPQAVPV
jgi:hypothetical protein